MRRTEDADEYLVDDASVGIHDVAECQGVCLALAERATLCFGTEYGVGHCYGVGSGNAYHANRSALCGGYGAYCVLLQNVHCVSFVCKVTETPL